MNIRTYYGANIYPVTRPTTWGARYESYVGGRFVMADTFEGIKELIRENLPAGAVRKGRA